MCEFCCSRPSSFQYFSMDIEHNSLSDSTGICITCLTSRKSPYLENAYILYFSNLVKVTELSEALNKAHPQEDEGSYNDDSVEYDPDTKLIITPKYKDISKLEEDVENDDYSKEDMYMGKCLVVIEEDDEGRIIGMGRSYDGDTYHYHPQYLKNLNLDFA